MNGEIQLFFLISQISKTEIHSSEKENDDDEYFLQNVKYQQTLIKTDKTEMLYSNGSLKSKDFINFLNIIKNVILKVKCPSNAFNQIKEITTILYKNGFSNTYKC